MTVTVIPNKVLVCFVPNSYYQSIKYAAVSRNIDDVLSNTFFFKSVKLINVILQYF